MRPLMLLKDQMQPNGGQITRTGAYELEVQFCGPDGSLHSSR